MTQPSRLAQIWQRNKFRIIFVVLLIMFILVILCVYKVVEIQDKFEILENNMVEKLGVEEFVDHFDTMYTFRHQNPNSTVRDKFYS